MATSNPSPAAAPINRPPQVALPPRVVPNSRRLDDSFPVFGLNVYCDHPAWFEILLTTDRSLFDPANASRRKPDNFYSSRQDSRLIPVQLGSAVYLAPSAVLRGFTSANPRPSEIYYTAVAYADADGHGAVFAQPMETLATSAPSVTVSRHYGSDGGLSAFGMDPAKLHRWQPPAMQPSGKPASGMSLAAASISDEEDRAGGEDGRYAAPPEQVNARPQSVDYDRGMDDDEPAEYGTAMWADPVFAAEAPDYDDGYGEPPATASLLASLAQQTSFRPGDPEPQELHDGASDDEDGRYFAARGDGGGRSSGDTSYSASAAYDDDEDDDTYRSRPYAAAASAGYGDEADEGGWRAEGSQAMAAVAPAAAPAPTPPAAQPEPAPAAPIPIEKKRDLIGKLGEYTATAADAEFNGVLGPDHPAYRRYHLGLSFGVVGFNQDAGHLGQLLMAMRERDAAKFSEIFGPDAETLIRVTAARGPQSAESRDGRSARVQPVGGADLWQDPWTARFREAGMHRPFQAVQNRLAAELFLDPELPFAHHMGFNTERGLAIVLDRASQMGGATAEQWIANSCGPLQTAQQRQQAVAALGFRDLRAYQGARHGIETDGQWGPRTHAALVDELRESGKSPVPLPTLDQMLDALVRRAAQTPWFSRLQALRNDVRFGDTPIHFKQRRHEGDGKQPRR